MNNTLIEHANLRMYVIPHAGESSWFPGDIVMLLNTVE